MKKSITALSVSKALILPAFVILPINALANETQFDPAFINSEYRKNIDLSQFSTAGSVLEGEYQVDIYVNDELSYSDRVKFKKNKSGTVSPCVSEKLIKHLYLNNNYKGSNESCVDLPKVIPGSRVQFDSSTQRLYVSIPQKYMKHLAIGEVPESDWDSGIAAAFLGYNFNTYQSDSANAHYSSNYLGINSGVNLGEWYFRHNGTWTSQTNSDSHYHALNTYVQHDLNIIRGRIVIGQSNTSGRLFDTLPFSGVSIFTDDQMLPQSRRGYAPEIRGFANTSAKVTVRQGEQVIYETTVSPGEFVLNDLYPSGYGGDLIVLIRESDGKVRTFSVPYASVADLLRPGVQRYELVAGKYRNNYSSGDGSPLYQFTFQRGVSNILTLYTGAEKSNNYFSGLIGMAVDTSFGALSTDITHSDTKLTDDNKKGESYRVSYNKYIQESGSDIALAAYRFSTRGYYNFVDAMHYKDLQRDNLWNGNVFSPKSKFIISLQQKLSDDFGQIYVSNIWLNSWGDKGSEKQYQIGYSNHWRKFSYTFSLNRSRLENGNHENNWLLSFNIPLGNDGNTSLSSGIGRDSSGHYNQQIGLSGSKGDAGQFSWNVQGSHSTYGESTANVSTQYRSQFTNVGAGISAGENSHSLSGNVSGAIVGHSSGITFTPYQADSYVVVSAPGATGAKLPGYSDVQIDYWGNAVVPVWSPYSINEIRIDPKGIPANIEMDETSQSTVPRAGAVTKTQFSTHKGYPLLFSPIDSNPLPFGSTVTDEKGNAIGIVSQGGLVYSRVSTEKGKLYTTWTEHNTTKKCIMPYLLNNNELNSLLIKRNYTCK